MTDLRAPTRARSTTARRGAGLFRAFWRWHFYASFLVIPILLVLATTGLIYLFRFQLEPLLNPELLQVEKPSASSIQQPYSAQLAAVEREFAGADVVSMAEPRDADRPTVFSIVTEDGSARDVYVNPYGAEVLGSQDPDGTLSGTAVRLHADLMSGTVGDRVTELGASWAIVMALTGYYLFFRGRRARRRSRAPGAKLRSRHAAVGSVVGLGLLMLLVSGLPWTGVWGEKAQQIASGRGTSFWATDPGAISDPTSTLDESLPHSHAHEVPWAQGDSEVPTSDAEGNQGSVPTSTPRSRSRPGRGCGTR